ncbi:DNA-directed RNA polymerase II subunit GRINL1A [Lucilia cuprina]|uniref:DNA-directed RNA polymerase II subunit GRINL1A n=1 Tax=Lucilia cuprina TaxID=7375 RepID=UPI001F067C7B|nr:DNA-directed RNA polymerase II subunit GRINL1A [Lucilia cuprina]XP_046804237.1 DNA-directed RNA polymerase II subunit GRINL1A [Lucilia cuprina]
MACILRPKLNKIPGGGMPLAKKESYAKDLTKLTQVELREIKEREEKLLQNKSKLQKLPDKGKRIQDFYDKVLQELERRSNVDEAAKIFSNLNIASQGEKALNELEWQGNLKNLQENLNPLDDVLDSDDETEMDPLKIIAQRQMHERKVKVEPPEVKLITEEDLKEIESFKTDSPDSGVTTESNGEETQAAQAIEAEIVAIDIKEKLDNIKPKLQTLNSSINSINGESRSSSVCSHTLDLEPHVHYLVDKTETHVQPPIREKFKPYRTTVSNVHDPEKERQRKQGKNWEVTAATPPPIQHNGTQLLNLMDSVEIQAQYLLKLKELQEKQAAERLAAKLKRLEDRKLQLPSEEELKTKPSFTKYREPKSQTHNIEGEQKFNEDDEVHDPLDEEKSGGVNYTVYE